MTARDQRITALYLSYDGMTDPLGEAQVIPYLCGLAAFGYEFHLVSFEKRKRFIEHSARVQSVLDACGIRWHPMFYTKRPPVASSVWDLIRLQRRVRALHRRHCFDLVHCRSYLPSIVGVGLKKQRGVRFIFDMRGFWADERVDGGLWDLSHPLYAMIYRYFKRREREFLHSADEIVSLTEAGKADLEKRRNGWSAPVNVIPCSVDFECFRVPNARERSEARNVLGIPADALVGTYLGSMGTWYLLPEMLALFSEIRRQNPGAYLLILTPDSPDPIRQAAVAQGVDPEWIIIRSVPRERVPFYLSATDYGMFFIKPSYSKLSSSPTKLGEYLSMGIPVITNTGVGDVDAVIARTGGYVVSSFDCEALGAAAHEIPRLIALDPQTIRAHARELFDLDRAVESYRRIYVRVLGSTPPNLRC